ncbi:MAG: M28 family peptidase [Halodesulfurarchaeum sp.]
MTAWIGEIFSSRSGWNHLETLVDIDHRLAGSDGERQGAEETADAFERFARNVRIETFDVPGWKRGSAGVEADERTESAIGLPLSPPGKSDGTLLDVGYGLPSDFEDPDVEGSVVLVRTDVPDWYDRMIHRREKYYRAIQAGAVGFVFQNHVEGRLPPTGSVGGVDGGVGDIPAVGVSNEVGERLRRRAAGNPVTVSVSAELFDGTSQNVHAELGPDTDEEVLVSSHVDAHDIAEGAMDNGAGTAMLIELAKALSYREDELETRVHFIAFGAEEIGLLGSEFDAGKRDLEDISAVINLDGVVRDRTLSFGTHGFDGLEAVAERVGDRFDHPIYVTPRQQPHSDHWPYVKWGVPGYHVSSHTTERGRGWGHTAGDTLDKLEARTFGEQAILLTELVVEVAREDVDIEHREPETVARALEDDGIATGLTVTGDWPYEIPDT